MGGGTACFYCFWTFLQEVQPVYKISELLTRDCQTEVHPFNSFWTYLQGTVRIQNTNFIYSRKISPTPGNCPWCSKCRQFPNLPLGDCRLGYKLFVYTFKNLLPEDCKSGMQSVYKVSVPTSRELSALVQPLYMVSESISRELSAGSEAFFACSEPTSWGASCFYVSKPSSKCYVLVIFLFCLAGVRS